MPTFKYRPYYSYKGPTRSEPMKEPLSDEEIQQRKEQFYDDIRALFEDSEAEIEITASGDVFISINLSKTKCDDKVEKCLNSFELYADKIA